MIVYTGSFDPAHKGHLNTYLKAKRHFGCDIDICICNNDIKPTGYFSMQERLVIAKSLFPTSNIWLVQGDAEIHNMFCNADIIIRGFRKSFENVDKRYVQELLQYYHIELMGNKIHYVEIDDEFEGVTSTMIKEEARTCLNQLSTYISHTAIQMFIEKSGC